MKDNIKKIWSATQVDVERKSEHSDDLETPTLGKLSYFVARYEVWIGASIAILLILPIFFTPYICKPFANEPNGVQTPPAFTAIAEWWNE